MPSSVAVRDRTAKQSINENVCPHGDYLLGVGDSVKVVLMLTENNRVGTKRITVGGLPGGPVAETLRSQCRGSGIDPWSENKILHATTKT